MKDTSEFRPSGSFERAMALLAVIGVTAGIGLAAFDPVSKGVARTLPTDANEQRQDRNRAPLAPVPAQPSGSGELDPSMRRIEHHGAHHG